jgi:hypothetical protein
LRDTQPLLWLKRESKISLDLRWFRYLIKSRTFCRLHYQLNLIKESKLIWFNAQLFPCSTNGHTVKQEEQINHFASLISLTEVNISIERISGARPQTPWVRFAEFWEEKIGSLVSLAELTLLLLFWKRRDWQWIASSVLVET